MGKIIESVWDYPRPPKLDAVNHTVEIYFNNTLIVNSVSTIRLLETSHPPVYYIPKKDIKMEYLKITSRISFCEYKGLATYYTITINDSIAENSVWTYENLPEDYLPLKDHYAFYPALMESCLVDGELIKPQEGDYYGGWITSNIQGPFKGSPGTSHW
jgi:uncharacterized protein (DUF427 family)